MGRFLHVIILFVGLFCGLTACSQDVPSAPPENTFHTMPLKISTQDGRDLFFQVEVADTDAARMQGLMFRREMPADHGMIFLFSDVRLRSFWMKNTYLPLDIIFVDEAGRIVSIREGRPLDETGIPSGVPAKAAIEFNQGTAAGLGIAVGDQVYFSEL